MASTSESPDAGNHPGHGGWQDLGDLHDHGDRQVPPGALDLAVNVLPDPPPGLAAVLAGVDLAPYPDGAAARAALAARHRVEEDEVLLVNGAAEAFWALAYGLRPTLAACVHPSFTAPEAAFRSAGVPVHRVLRHAEDDFRLDVGQVPDSADCVVLGRPDNPTGRSEPVRTVEQLGRDGRTVVVDEAFAELAGDGLGLPRDIRCPGLLRVRSLTKVWGLAGLRVGYVVGPAATLRRLGSALQPWPVNSLALAAVEWLFGVEHGPRLDGERLRRAQEVAAVRRGLAGSLRRLPGVQVWGSDANFLLLRTRLPDLRERLLQRGIAVRRGESFPGLESTYVRIAVSTEPAAAARLLTALRELLPADS